MEGAVVVVSWIQEEGKRQVEESGVKSRSCDRSGRLYLFSPLFILSGDKVALLAQAAGLWEIV